MIYDYSYQIKKKLLTSAYDISYACYVIESKTKSQQIPVAKPELLALCIPCPCTSVSIEEPAANGPAAGRNPARGIKLLSPAGSCYYR